MTAPLWIQWSFPPSFFLDWANHKGRRQRVKTHSPGETATHEQTTCIQKPFKSKPFLTCPCNESPLCYTRAKNRTVHLFMRTRMTAGAAMEMRQLDLKQEEVCIKICLSTLNQRHTRVKEQSGIFRSKEKWSYHRDKQPQIKSSPFLSSAVTMRVGLQKAQLRYVHLSEQRCR